MIISRNRSNDLYKNLVNHKLQKTNLCFVIWYWDTTSSREFQKKSSSRDFSRKPSGKAKLFTNSQVWIEFWIFKIFLFCQSEQISSAYSLLFLKIENLDWEFVVNSLHTCKSKYLTLFLLLALSEESKRWFWYSSCNFSVNEIFIPTMKFSLPTKV